MNELAVLARDRRQDRPAIMRGAFDWNSWAANRASIDYVDALTTPQRSEDRVHHESAEAYSRGELNYVELVQPANSADVVMLGESLAERGDEAAVEYAQALRAMQPTDADAVLARLRFKQKRFDEAAALLESTFVSCRTDPWPNVDTIGRSLDLAVALSNTQRYAARMFHALDAPFAAGQWEDARKIDRAFIAHLMEGCGPHTVAALKALEPWAPWRRDLLKLRVDCYGSAMLSDLHARATRDLDAFTRAEPLPLLSSSDRR
jgi:hypothetical protein